MPRPALPKNCTIIINPSPELALVLETSSERHRVRIFCDLAAYDRWRHDEEKHCETIEREVRWTLTELAVEPRFFRHELRNVIELLCTKPRVPRLEDLFVACGSERTLYRIWNPAIPATPARFLGRVRVLHAIRLQENHSYSAKRAAFEAGFSNPTMLRRALNSGTSPISDPAGRNRHTLAGIGV